MFADLKQFLSSDICLSCEGCCRFDSQQSDWRAKAGKEEEVRIAENLSLAGKLADKNIVDHGGYIEAHLCHGLYACKHFNPEDTTCQIYHARPFECRLYPFVLTGLNNQPAVSVHLSCPFIQLNKDTEAYHEYVRYLRVYFQNPQLVQFLADNPHLFGAYTGYEDELEEVFPVSV